jgi:hypothetical protein
MAMRPSEYDPEIAPRKPPALRRVKDALPWHCHAGCFLARASTAGQVIFSSAGKNLDT